MRKFYLQNEKGERKALQGGEIFFHVPQGLGISIGRNYDETYYGFFQSSNQTWQQSSVTGELIFSGKQAYANYAALVQWIAAAEQTQLVYIPYEGKELLRDVDIESIELSERAKYGVLECPITMMVKSPYYRTGSKTYHPVEREGTGMRFPFQFPFRFAQSGAEGISAEILADGQFPAGIAFRGKGPFSKPVLTLKNADTGKEYGKLDLTPVTIESDETLVYSTVPGKMGVWRESGQGTATTQETLMNSLDLQNKNFFRVPVNTRCVLTFEAQISTEHVDLNQYTINIYEYFIA